MKKIIDEINKTPKDALIAIVAHHHGDPDAAFSMMALYLSLVQLSFNNVKILFDENTVDIYKKSACFVDMPQITKEVLSPDILFVLDASVATRLGDNIETLKQSKKVIVLDHHLEPTIKTDFLVSEPTSPAACALVYKLLKGLKVSLTPEMATCLYVGMRCDTVSFGIPLEPETFQILKEIAAVKFDVTKAINAIAQRLSINEFEYLSEQFKKRRICGKITTIILRGKEMLKKKIASSTIKEKGLMLYRGIEGNEILCILRVMKNEISGSLRSSTDKDINELAAVLGGGGHKKASGFTTKKSLPEVLKIISLYDFK